MLPTLMLNVVSPMLSSSSVPAPQPAEIDNRRGLGGDQITMENTMPCCTLLVFYRVFSVNLPQFPCEHASFTSSTGVGLVGVSA